MQTALNRLIECAIAGLDLLANVLVAKFRDHLPLYRQFINYARERTKLDRTLLASWVSAAAHWSDAIRKHVLNAHIHRKRP